MSGLQEFLDADDSEDVDNFLPGAGGDKSDPYGAISFKPGGIAERSSFRATAGPGRVVKLP